MRGLVLLGFVWLLSACAASGEPGPAEELASPIAPFSEAPASRFPAPPELPAAVPLLVRDFRELTFSLHAVDPSTGENAPGFEPILISGRYSYYAPTHAISKDGRLLASVVSNRPTCEDFSGGSGCRANAAGLVLIDIPAWSSSEIQLAGDGWAWPVTFNPAGDRVALAFNNEQVDRLMVFDVKKGGLTAERELGLRPSLIEFSAGGSRLIVYGQARGEEPGISEPTPPRVQVFDSRTLAMVWDYELEGVASGHWCVENCENPHQGPDYGRYSLWEPAVAYSGVDNRLLIAHADEDKLTTVDLTSFTVQTADIQARLSWWERLLAALGAQVAEAKGWPDGVTLSGAVSPDGRRFYVVGTKTHSDPLDGEQGEVHQEFLGLQVIDTASAERLGKLESNAWSVEVSADGGLIFLRGHDERLNPTTVVVNARTLKPIATLGNGYLSLVYIDGEPVLLDIDARAAESRVSLYSSTTFEEVHSWTLKADVGVWPSP